MFSSLLFCRGKENVSLSLALSLFIPCPSFFFCGLISLHGEETLMACCGFDCFCGDRACRYGAFVYSRGLCGISARDGCGCQWQIVARLQRRGSPPRYVCSCKAVSQAAPPNEILVKSERSRSSPGQMRRPITDASPQCLPLSLRLSFNLSSFSSGDDAERGEGKKHRKPMGQ